MTITEFLLARIAEDEGKAQHDAGTSPNASLVQGYAKRLLAECEVKRRIVARFRWADDSRGWTEDMELQVLGLDAEDTLRDLAAVYSAHPEYDEAWRA